MKGITRYADVHVPMDEALTRVAIDISGRPFLVFKAEFVRDKVGTFDTELVQEWFQAFAMNCRRHAARRDAVRQQRPSYRRILLQGLGAGVARGGRDRSRARRTRSPRPRARSAAEHSRHAVRSQSVREKVSRPWPIYTVHEPPLKADETRADPERFVFVRDGFSFWAFLLAPLWMLRHRLWLVLLGYRRGRGRAAGRL